MIDTKRGVLAGSQSLTQTLSKLTLTSSTTNADVIGFKADFVRFKADVVEPKADFVRFKSDFMEPKADFA